jgi:hypothetical protein
MVLKYLTVEQMKEVTRRWVDPGEPRSLLESFTQTKGLLVDVERVHKGLLEYVPVPTVVKRVEEIRDIELVVDEAYDDALRGNYYTMSAQFNYTSDKELSAWLRTTRDALLPDGLAGTQKTLREESGAAQLLELKLRDELVKTRLSAIPVANGVSLYDKFLQQAELGKSLGPLEDQKDEALKSAASEVQGPTDAAVRRSHLEWISVVRLVERSLQLARPGKDVTEKIMGTLQKVADIAQQRRDAQISSQASVASSQEKTEPEKAES